MALIHMINSILADNSLDAEECEKSKCEAIESLISVYGWESVQETVLRVLTDDGRSIRDYEVVAEVIWGAALDNREILPKNRVTALLYLRLPKDKNSSENNLSWSIASKLKNVGYLADYDPLEDTGVIEEMNRIRYKG